MERFTANILNAILFGLAVGADPLLNEADWPGIEQQQMWKIRELYEGIHSVKGASL